MGGCIWGLAAGVGTIRKRKAMATGPFTIEDMLAALDQMKPAFPSQTFLVSPKTRASLEAATFNSGPNVIPSSPLAEYSIKKTFMGIGMEVHDIPPEVVYDWSDCRSPARAQRRHKLGYLQRVKITHKEVAYLVDKDALRRMTDGWERRAMKMLIG